MVRRSAKAIGDDPELVLSYGEIAWFLLTYRHDTLRSAIAIDEAEAVAVRLDEPRFLAWNLFLRARREIETGEYLRGLGHCDEAIGVFESGADPELRLYALPLKAELLGRLGRSDEALKILEEAVRKIAEFSYLAPHVRELARVNVARIAAAVYRASGDLDRCIAVCTEAFERASYLRAHPVMLTILMERGSAYRDRGDFGAAERDFSDAATSFPSVVK